VRAPSRALGDATLAAFAVVVLAACVLVVQRTDAPVTVSTLGQDSPVGTPSGSPDTRATPSAQAPGAPATLVIAGPDLAKLGTDLVAASGDTVLVAESTGTRALADGALAGIKPTPAAVVLQILAGSKTSVRTTEAVAAVRKRWPDVKIVLVGPFGADDRKSAAAVKSAAAAAHVTFLDPVELKWRSDAAEAAVGAADFRAIAAKIAAALQ
jgi:hypothetical protein